MQLFYGNIVCSLTENLESIGNNVFFMWLYHVAQM